MMPHMVSVKTAAPFCFALLHVNVHICMSVCKSVVSNAVCLIIKLCVCARAKVSVLFST